MRRLVQVVESEIVDSALQLLGSLIVRERKQSTHLAQELPQDNKEAHQVARVAGKDTLSIAAAHVLCGGAHSWRNDLARCVHQQLRKPLEDFLDDLRIRLLQICNAELDSDVCYTSGNLVIRLEDVSIVSRRR